MVKEEKLLEGDKILITAIKGTIEFQNHLLAIGISTGSIIQINYSPRFAKLINFTLGSKMMSLRFDDFNLLEYVKL